MPIRDPAPNFTGILDDDNTDPPICDNCDSVGIYSPLGPRVYAEDENDEDAENWRQCYSCGQIYPKYAIRGQNKVRGFKQPDLNPFGTDFNQTRKLEPSYNIRKIKVSKLYKDDDKEIDQFRKSGAIINE
jgi:hypothetical protein